MSKLLRKLSAKNSILQDYYVLNHAPDIHFYTAGRIMVGQAQVQVIEISKGRMRGKLEFMGSSETEILRVIRALEGCNTDSHPLWKDRSKK